MNMVRVKHILLVQYEIQSDFIGLAQSKFTRLRHNGTLPILPPTNLNKFYFRVKHISC